MKHFQFKLSVLILAMILLAQFSSAAQADSKKIDGFGIGSGTHLRVGTTGLSAALDEQQWMGVHWSREDLPWEEVEGTRGNFQTTYPFDYGSGIYALRDYNMLLTESAKRDIQVVFILGARAGYMAPRGRGNYIPTPDEFQQQWEEYVTWAVNTFGDQVSAWEINNEMNSRMFWGKVVSPTLDGKVDPDPAFYYERILQPAYRIIKQKDPNDIIILGGLVTITDSDCATNPFVYLGQLHDLGAWNSFDAIGFHPYWDTNPEAFIQRGKAHDPNTGACMEGMTATRNLIGEMREARDLANKFGSKPIWVTEIGWNESWLASRAAERDTSTDVIEADYLVRTYVPLLSENGIDKIFWYTQIEHPLATNEDFRLGNNGKQALRNLSILLNGGEALGQVQGQNDKGGAADDDAYEYRFKNNGKTIIVAWKARGGDAPRTVSIQNIPTESVRVYQADGADISDTTGNELIVVSNSVNVDLTERPVFIVFEETNAAKKAWDDFIINLGKWWDKQNEAIQRQIKEWRDEQTKKLADWFDQWWEDFQKQLADWFEQQAIGFLEQLCNGSAFILPSLAVMIAVSRKHRHSGHWDDGK